MLPFVMEQRPVINRALKAFLRSKEADFGAVNGWGADVLKRLECFTDKGKMIRGCLTVFSCRMFSGQISQAAVDVAVAMELIQAAFLIHDDIMDQDVTRRGAKTVFFQYQEIGEAENFPDSADFGKSMGICVGDIAFFLAFEILNSLAAPDEMRNKIMTAVTKEIYSVGLAQMQDVYFGNFSKMVTEQDIISIFRHKTARYTFSLPLKLGAILAGEDSIHSETLEKIGEILGIIFQIKDDELGLYGDEKETGKPLGSDIKMAKKTLYYLFLMEIANREQKKRLSEIFGNSSISRLDVEWVRDLVEKLGVRERVRRKVNILADQVYLLMSGLDIPCEDRDILNKMVQYSLSRIS